MLSRIRRMIKTNRETVGMILVGFGLMWILFVAGVDDAAVLMGMFSSVWALIAKIAVGLAAAAQGVKLINAGGAADEDPL